MPKHMKSPVVVIQTMCLGLAAAAALASPGSGLRPALASWYDDRGATASGHHYRRNFASLMFGSRWGLRVVFEHNGRWATGRLGDHGPYVAGRAFDLGPELKAALGCGDLCRVRWRLG